MRPFFSILGLGLICGLTAVAWAEDASISPTSTPTSGKHAAPSQIEVTADQSLEWYQDERMYVARGNAKAVRGDMIIEADTLTAHERDKPETTTGAKPPKLDKTKTANGQGDDNGTGDIDKMTAEGNVRITDPKQHVTGDHLIYDLDQHVAIVTGNNLKYETDKEIVTAKDSLEYWENKKIAVARGDAVAVQGEKRVTSDVLTAEFRDAPNGQQELWKMTCVGHVTIVTKTDVTRGDKAVDDAARNIAIISGHVRITRLDGTQLSGDVGEVDFNDNQSRLMNEGTGRVRALLTSKSTSKAGQPAPTKAAAATP